MPWHTSAMVRHGNDNRSVVVSNLSIRITVLNVDGSEECVEVPERFTMGVVFDPKTFKAYIYGTNLLGLESDFSDVYELLDGNMNLLTFLYIGE